MIRSRFSWPGYVALAGLVITTACAKPTTYHPEVTIEEIEQEALLQQAAADSDPFEKIEGEVEITQAMLNRMDRIESSIVPHANALCRELFADPDHRCEFTTEVSAEAKGINAFADGKRVVMGPTMMQFASNDTHVAFVLSHELAHNIMTHVDSGLQNTIGGLVLGTALDVAVGAAIGTGTGGLFGQLGAQQGRLQYSPGFETEADYVGLYILARSGYRIEEAPHFWRAMSQYDPQGIYTRSSHPTNAERFVIMRKTIAEIRSKQKNRLPLTPEFLQVEN